MLWIAALVVVAVATVVLGVLAARLQREVGPTQHTLGRVDRRVRPALVRVRDTSAELRRRLPRD